MTSSRLRIAFVTETYPPEIGGAATCAGRFVEALLARGHDVQLVRPRQGVEHGQGSRAGLETVLVPGVPVPFHGGLQLGLPRGGALLRDWGARPPDLVHLVSEGMLGRSALRAARRLRIPFTSSFHTNFPSYGRHYGLGWLKNLATAYLRAFHNCARLTLVPTGQVRDQLTAEGFRDLVVVGRGVDTQAFHPERRRESLRRQWGASPDDLVALLVGRLAPEKNVPLAVRAFRAMEPSRRVRLVLVGEGPERKRLQRENPDVVFTGMLRGDALAEHYASADVFLFPSLTETFGNVTLEAMSSGLAVVAYDDAAAAQHIRPFTSGLLAPRGDAAEFVAHARRLAAQPSLARRLGLGARQAVLPYGWDRIGDAFTSVVEAVAFEHAHARRAAPPARPRPPRTRRSPSAGSVGRVGT